MNNQIKKYILVIIFLSEIVFPFSNAQVTNNSINTFLKRDFTERIDDFYIRNPSLKFHSSFKPYSSITLRDFKDSSEIFRSFSGNFSNFSKSILQKPSDRKTFDILVLPIIDLQAGYDLLKDNFVDEKSGGLYLRSEFHDDFSFAVSVSGGSSNYPVFTDTFIKNLSVIPGNGIAYKTQNGYQWANLSGYISYTAANLFNLQIGKDKHFIGEGYRSLMLSDVANNYPYFRSSLNIWNIQYSCWYSWFYDLYNANSIKSKFLNRFGTFHYLSWNINSNINLSFFESIIWQGTDSNRVRNFDLNYINPVIFYRPVEYSLGSSDNAFIGLNFSWKYAKKFKFYTQILADEFYLQELRHNNGWWANKQAWQVGMKYIDVFGLKNMCLQVEFNTVRPYTYSHGSPQQSYSHYYQPLAHPFGANFYEGIGMMRYQHKRWSLDVKLVYANLGMDTAGSVISMGQNIFLSYNNRPKLGNGNPQDFGHYISQGVKTNYFQSDLKVTYFLIPDFNFRFELGYIQTNLANELGFERQAPFIYFALRSGISNFYRDF